MKALVTGSNGFLGASLVERLIAHGNSDIRCLVRPGSDRSRLGVIQDKYPQIRLDIFTGTLNSPSEILPALSDVKVIYHLAAGMRGTAADLFLSSVITSKNLIEALTPSTDIRVVLVSSFGVYGTSNLRRGHVITENSPLESAPERRDLYSYAKWRQERLFREAQERHGFPLVILRPGVIYGPSGPAMSSRVGLELFGSFLFLGGRNTLPLSYVDNCAEAIVTCGESPLTSGQIFNVHDDDLPTCAMYLKRYRREVKIRRVVRVPYWLLMFLSRRVENYSIRSKGQLPAVFTPYKTAASWKGCRFDNSKLKSIGWRPIVTTDEGMDQTFAHLKSIVGFKSK